jgi:hypothetical protein
LAPFAWHDDRLHRVVRLPKVGPRRVALAWSTKARTVRVAIVGQRIGKTGLQSLRGQVPWMLRADEDFSEFWTLYTSDAEEATSARGQDRLYCLGAQSRLVLTEEIMEKVEKAAPKKEEPMVVSDHTDKTKSQVLAKIGKPLRLDRVDVCQQHGRKYRVNTWEQPEPSSCSPWSWPPSPPVGGKPILGLWRGFAHPAPHYGRTQ